MTIVEIPSLDLTSALWTARDSTTAGPAREAAYRLIGARIRAAAGRVVYPDCHVVVLDDVIQLANHKVHRVLAGGAGAQFPWASTDPDAESRNHGYLAAIVRNAFRDRARSLKRQGACGVVAAMRRLDPPDLERGLELLDVSGVLRHAAANPKDSLLPLELVQTTLNELLRRAAGERMSALIGLPTDAPELDARRGELRVRHDQVKRRLHRAVLRQIPPGDDRDLALHLLEHLDTRPPKPRKPNELLDPEDIALALRLLVDRGVLKRIERDGGGQGRSATALHQDLTEMIRLKTTPGIDVAELLGLPKDHVDFIRLRDAQQQRHKRARDRIEAKVGWMVGRPMHTSPTGVMLTFEECRQIMVVLAFLKRRTPRP
jgi:hypothetical protein